MTADEGSRRLLLRPEPLDAAAFAPFGAVLAPKALPLPVRLFKRHPGSCQVFAALTVERFLVVVAPAGPDGLPDPAGTRAFLGRRGDVIRYGRGQWHAPMVALDAGGDMLMLAFERGARGDTIEHRLPAAVLVADRPPNGTERP